MVAGRWRCSTSIFAFLPRLKFFFGPLLKTGHFQGISTTGIINKLYIYKRFPPKDLKKILVKNMILNAHACIQSGGSVPHQFLPSFEGSKFFGAYFLELVTFKAFRRVKETLVSGNRRGGRGFPRQLVTLLSFDLPPH